tara:strand:- start:291 stop:449 length:159 start_codon:yes stop_codon:yes gene_type:complete
MREVFTPTFLKFLTRFVLIVLIGVVGALVAGYIDVEQKEARTYQPTSSERIP